VTPSTQAYPKGVYQRNCEACGAVFMANSYRLNIGQGRFCSRKCYHQNHPYVPLETRFWKMVKKSRGCWEWIGSLTPQGYGQISGRPQVKRALLAHRVSWALANGKVPKGLQLDHLCRNRKCVNPQHLEPVTSRINVLRGISPPAVNARMTKCKRGHALSDAYIWRGMRFCRTCRKMKNKLRRDRREA
jgi:hypothetical protein